MTFEKFQSVLNYEYKLACLEYDELKFKLATAYDNRRNAEMELLNSELAYEQLYLDNDD